MDFIAYFYGTYIIVLLWFLTRLFRFSFYLLPYFLQNINQWKEREKAKSFYSNTIFFKFSFPIFGYTLYMAFCSVFYFAHTLFCTFSFFHFEPIRFPRTKTRDRFNTIRHKNVFAVTYNYISIDVVLQKVGDHSGRFSFHHVQDPRFHWQYPSRLLHSRRVQLRLYRH